MFCFLAKSAHLFLLLVHFNLNPLIRTSRDKSDKEQIHYTKADLKKQSFFDKNIFYLLKR